MIKVENLTKRYAGQTAIENLNFEVGKGEVGKGGIVTDAGKHQQVIKQIDRAAEELGLKVCGLLESPIRGAEGNREFLALYEGTPGSTTKTPTQ